MKLALTPWVGSVLVVCAGACQSSTLADLQGLADQPPLEYSVLVSGGAFVDEQPTVASRDGVLARTFGGDDGTTEAIPLDRIVRALETARAFSRVDLDRAADSKTRELIAAIRGPLPLDQLELRQLLERARRDGHDYVLVVQRLLDAPVEEYGINDRWPLTLSLWLIVGLGMFVPDHSYESRAALHAAMFEVNSGQLVYRTVEGGGPVELSMVNRSSGWGIVTSIIIPPFWVASTPEYVRERVRGATTQRILFSLARQLKSVACQQVLFDASPATIATRRVGRAWRIEVRSRAGLSVVRLRVDGATIDDGRFAEFERRLLDSERADDGFAYAAEIELPPGRFLQILVQTVAGEIASSTIDLRAP